MWLSFALSTACAACFTFLPGYIAARTLRFDRVVAFCVAPLLTLATIGLLAVVYGYAGIMCSPATLIALPVAIFSLTYLLVSRAATHDELNLGAVLQAHPDKGGVLTRLGWGAIALVLGCSTGLILCLVVFVARLATPAAFLQNYDSAWHLWHIRSFFESGRHSSLAGGFYPSAYHSLCALVQAALGISSAQAQNAVTYGLPALAYPAASTLLLATIFPDSPRKVVVGSFFCLSIAFFPWRLVLFGPLYPNIAAFSLIPAEAAAFIRLCSPKGRRGERLSWAAVFVAGGIALALTQPNAIFSTGVFLIPFLLSSAWHAVVRRHPDQRLPWQALLANVAILLAIACIWYALYKAPFMQPTVQYPRESGASPIRALKWALALCFMAPRQQYLLGVIVLLGIAAMLIRDHQRWVCCSYFLLIGLYVVAYAVDGELKHLLTGFWYCDLYRLAAVACIFAIPIIAEGMDLLIDTLAYIRGRFGAKRERAAKHADASASLAAVTSFVVLMLNCLPLPFIPFDARSFAFDTVAIEIDANFNWIGWRYLKEDEVTFLLRASELVPEGEVLLNQPFDGSVFAESAYGIPVRYNMFGPAGEADVLIRARLCDVATDAEVQRALSELGIHYLIMLDQSDKPIPTNRLVSIYDLGYNPDEWVGINRIRDDTPGFTLLLSEGDMRLYRIDY